MRQNNLNFILHTVSFETILALSCKKVIHSFVQRQDLGGQKALSRDFHKIWNRLATIYNCDNVIDRFHVSCLHYFPAVI